MIKKLFIFKIFVLILFVFIYNIISAIEKPYVYLETLTNNINFGSEFSVDVFVDTTVLVNAFDLEIKYQDQDLEFIRFSDAGSVVDIWQASPQLTTSGNIKLTGGIFKSFSGNQGKLVTIYFKSKSNIIKSSILLSKVELFLANGSGTKVDANTKNLDLNFLASQDANSIFIAPLKEDSTAPVISMYFTQSTDMGRKLIVFDVDDNESGVKDTQIRFKKLFTFSEWQSVTNPVIYEEGVWKVELKATNHQGVESVKSLVIQSVLFKKLFFAFLAVSILVILSLWVYNILKRKRIK